MSHSAFRKSWGAEPLGDGHWRFRIWAPELEEMTLVLADRHRGMDRVGGGWFATEISASDGESYSYLTPAGIKVPDPAARAQVTDVHGPSLLVDPAAFDWRCDWGGRPWEETILYELHVGAFSDTHDFDGVRHRLDHLAATGVTAIELCPVAQFSGTRGWGYDGVLLYAPHVAYGGPVQLKRLVDTAHERDLMVFLDVVYNHFGPEGNYLHAYAPHFFHEERHTPWGAAIAFEQPPVRQFFVENALYWLDEYRFDGLRLDAVDQIEDQSDEPILEEIARAVREYGFNRPVHLTTEDDRNVTHLHVRDDAGRPMLFNGEWNDDFHHVAHVLSTGETEGYYGDYAADPRGDMMVALCEGFVHQGRPSPYRNGALRGELSGHLPSTAFVNFIQNHDQTGNRAFGERLTTLAKPEAVEALTALLILSPAIPLIFMGEEWGETHPFQFFCDFHGELAREVRQGRHHEFVRWPQFADAELRETIPDPNDPATFERSVLGWEGRDAKAGRERLALFRTLTAIRSKEVAPRLTGAFAAQGGKHSHGDRGLSVDWTLGDGSRLTIVANLGGRPFEAACHGRELFHIGNHESDDWALYASIEEMRA